MATNSKIFISYSWKDSNIVNEIDNDFKKVGITLTRDIRDASGYKILLKEFMNSIRNNEYVLMVISNSFLKSVNCLYEVLEISKEKDFKSKILQIVLNDANVFKTEGRLEYITYWKQEYNNLNNKVKGQDLKDLGSISKDLNLLDTICNNIGNFLDFLSEERSVPYELLKKTGYKAILDYIGFSDLEIIEEIFKIIDIKEKEQQDLAIDEFIYRNHSNYLGYMTRALIEIEREKFIKAIKDFNIAIELNPDEAFIYKNRGIAYASIKNWEEALKDCNKSIELDPSDEDAYTNRGFVYINIECWEEALKDYDKAIELDPGDRRNYSARGYINIIKEDWEKALMDYDKTIELNPVDAKAYNIRGNIYKTLGMNKKAEQDYIKYEELK